MMKRRKLVQVICAVLYNCNITGFAKGTIYKGDTKGICVPGLNCYSCPGAVGACPLGSLQSALVSSKYKLPYYVLGILIIFGLLLGRVICGFLCPFGLLQELLYKIPTPKLKKSSVTRRLSYLKYVILAVFVVIIPLSLAMPGFCKFICPAGTLEGGIPLVIMNESLRKMIGWLFSWKTLVLAAVIVGVVFVYRGFCRFICPLGAIYGFFNKVSLFGIKLDKNKCVGCSKCVRECKMDVKNVGDNECINCGECMEKCPTKAIAFGLKANTYDSIKLDKADKE